MRKLRAIHRALVNLSEELQIERVNLESSSELLVVKAKSLLMMECAESALPEKILITPRILLEICENSVVVECEFVANDPISKKKLSLKVFPCIQFILDGPRDAEVVASLSDIYREYNEVQGASSTLSFERGILGLEEFKNFLIFLKKSI
ncbi:hypothetical protein [Rufibacter immobilis]|uniref:hypothetical protein n=1 Tax=Rufibacter immobilis TaxID=1348778 RepID=UPI0035E8116B